MNQKFQIQYLQFGCQMLKPPNELLGFERNKIEEQKIKSSYPTWIRKKLKHKRPFKTFWDKLINFIEKQI